MKTPIRILRVFENANINRLIERYIVGKHLQCTFLQIPAHAQLTTNTVVKQPNVPPTGIQFLVAGIQLLVAELLVVICTADNVDTNKGCNLHLKCSVDSQVFSLLMYVIENIFCSISLRVAGYVSLPNNPLIDFKFQVHLGSKCVLGPSAFEFQVCFGTKCVSGPSVSRFQVSLGPK